jgi:heptosyltransferase-2
MKDKILVIQTAFLGDAILTLPMIEKLHEKFPDSLIDVIGIKSSKEIYESSPFVNEVHVFEKRGKHKSIPGIYRFAKFLREKNYSKVYSPHRSIRTSLLIFFLKVKETYGFDTSTLGLVYKYKIKYRKEYHEVRRLLEIIGFQSDEENWKIIPKIKENSSVKEKIETLTKDIPGKIIALAPGSVWETKKYPSGYFGKLAAMLSEAGYSVVLIGGAADAELCQNLSREAGRGVYSFAGRLSILESVYLLKKCSLVV